MLCHAEQSPCGNIEEPAMAITDWPVEERPREKLLQRGPAALSDAELLAIFLRTGVRGKTAGDLARDLLREYGGLRALREADQTRFCAGNGLGEAKYVQLQAVLEMGRRHLFETLKRGEGLGSPADTRLTRQLRDALALVDVRVLDHMVVGDGDTVSLAERGEL